MYAIRNWIKYGKNITIAIELGVLLSSRRRPSLSLTPLVFLLTAWMYTCNSGDLVAREIGLKIATAIKHCIGRRAKIDQRRATLAIACRSNYEVPTPECSTSAVHATLQGERMQRIPRVFVCVPPPASQSQSAYKWNASDKQFEIDFISIYENGIKCGSFFPLFVYTNLNTTWQNWIEREINVKRDRKYTCIEAGAKMGAYLAGNKIAAALIGRQLVTLEAWMRRSLLLTIALWVLLKLFDSFAVAVWTH